MLDVFDNSEEQFVKVCIKYRKRVQGKIVLLQSVDISYYNFRIGLINFCLFRDLAIFMKILPPPLQNKTHMTL